jgi:hypothetical protein
MSNFKDLISQGVNTELYNSVNKDTQTISNSLDAGIKTISYQLEASTQTPSKMLIDYLE